MGLFNFRERSRERRSFHKLNLDDLPASCPFPAEDFISHRFLPLKLYTGSKSLRVDARLISGFKLSKMTGSALGVG